MFQSAHVGEEQYHLIDAAAELGRSELAAQFMALLGGNPFPRKKWAIPYREFEELCLARSREREAERESAAQPPDTEEKEPPCPAAPKKKASRGGIVSACVAVALLCGCIFAYPRWDGVPRGNARQKTQTEASGGKTASEKISAANTATAGNTATASRQTEKERYSGSLPVEGMPVRCLKYTSLGEPDNRLDCKNFDKLETHRKYFHVYWYDENGETIAAGMCAQWEGDEEFMLKSFSQYYPRLSSKGQTFVSGNSADTGAGSGHSLREDYGDPEDLYEDGGYDDIDEAWDEWEARR